MRKMFRWLLRSFGGLDEINAALARVHGRYLDAQAYAAIEGISVKRARQALIEGAELGLLKKKYLYSSPKVEVPLVVDESELDTEVSLAEYGIESENDDKVFLSRFDAREIYVDSEVP